MMGAREATFVEMNKIQTTTGEEDLWKLITIAEIHERQNKALLSLLEGDRPRGSLPPGERPEEAEALMVCNEVSKVQCTWCSKMGHREDMCKRQDPLCGECGAAHPTRRHDEIVAREKRMREVEVQVAVPQEPYKDDGSTGGMPSRRQGHDFREGQQSYRERERGNRWGDGQNGRGGWRRGYGGQGGRGGGRGRQIPSREGRNYPPNGNSPDGWRQQGRGGPMQE